MDFHILPSMRRTKIEFDRKPVLEFENIVKRRNRAVREVSRERILPLPNSGNRNDGIVETLGVNWKTLLVVRKRYLRGGIASALHDNEKFRQPRKYGDRGTAEIIVFAFSSPLGEEKALVCPVDS